MLKTKLEVVTVGAPDVTALSENEQRIFFETIAARVLELAKEGLLHKGKPFVANTVYGILGNERYSGIYRHNGEVFDNIYPQIVPKETFDKVRAKVNANKFGNRFQRVINYSVVQAKEA